MRLLGVLAVLTMAAGSADGQTAQPLKDGAIVALVIPLSALDTLPTKPYRQLLYLGPTDGVGARLSFDDGGRVVVNGSSEWGTDGFIETAPRKLDDIKRRKKEGETLFIFTRKNAPKVVYIIPTVDEERFWRAVAYDTATVDSLNRASWERLRPRTFTGALSALSLESQDRLLSWLQVSGGGIASEKFKDREYFAIEMPSLGVVYNTLQMNETQRVADVVKKHLLDALKTFGPVAAELPDGYGLKLLVFIGHRSFLQRYSSADYDRLELYVPVKAIAAFANADITSQKLLDESIAMVNGNRTEVRLEQR